MATIASTSHVIDTWFTTLSLEQKEAITTVLTTTLDPLFFQSTKTVQPVMIVVADRKQCVFVRKSFVQNELQFYPFIVTEDEVQQLSTLHPIEFFIFRSFSSLFYGENILNSVVLLRDSHYEETLRELQQLIFHVRSTAITITPKSIRPFLEKVTARLYPLLLSLLSLDSAPITVQWGQVVAAVESRCSIKSFILSQIITFLEGNAKEFSLSLDSTIDALEESLYEIFETLKRQQG